MQTCALTNPAIQQGNELYQAYGNSAIKAAIESNYSLEVLKYLFEIKKCPLENIDFISSYETGYSYFGVETFDNEIDADTSWVAALLAAEYGRLDILKWLDEENYDLRQNYLLPDKTNLLEEAIEFKQYDIINWLITTSQAKYKWDDVIHFLDRNSYYLGRASVFLDFSERYLTEFLRADNLAQHLSIGQSKAVGFCFNDEKAEQETFKAKYITILRKALEMEFFERATNQYYVILNGLEKVDQNAAFESHSELLIRNANFQEVKNYCYANIEKRNANYELACIRLAELLLADHIELDEKGSPLELLPIHQNQLKRALQGFYLLQNCQSDFAKHLKRKLHDILSGVRMPFVEQTSVQTWVREAMFYFPLYLAYKQNPADSNIHEIISRYKKEEFQQIKSIEDNMNPEGNKRKYRQTFLNEFIKDRNKSVSENDTQHICMNTIESKKSPKL